MPKAYVIAEVDVQDAQTYEQYKAGTPGSIAKFGGQFVVRGGAATLLEGAGPVHRMVVIEFPTVEQAQSWYDSEEYRALRAIRQNASIGRVVLVEGA